MKFSYSIFNGSFHLEYLPTLKNKYNHKFRLALCVSLYVPYPDRWRNFLSFSQSKRKKEFFKLYLISKKGQRKTKQSERHWESVLWFVRGNTGVKKKYIQMDKWTNGQMPWQCFWWLYKFHLQFVTSSVQAEFEGKMSLVMVSLMQLYSSEWQVFA